MDFVAIDHIVITNGRPQVAGKGVSVQAIVTMYVRNQAPLAWIQQEFDLTPAEIYAALAYYYDHQAELDAAFHEAEALTQKIATPSDEVLARLHSQKPSRG